MTEKTRRSLHNHLESLLNHFHSSLLHGISHDAIYLPVLPIVATVARYTHFTWVNTVKWGDFDKRGDFDNCAAVLLKPILNLVIPLSSDMHL